MNEMTISEVDVSAYNRIKRLPAYLRSKLTNLTHNDTHPETVQLILATIDALSSESSAFEDNIGELTQRMHAYYESNDLSAMTIVYDFLLYFSNINPLVTYPDNEGNIPSEFRVVTSSQHCFDVRALIEHAVIKDKALINPINQVPFFYLDQKRIFNMANALTLDIENRQGEPSKYAGFEAKRYKVISREGRIEDFSESRIQQALLGAIESVYRDSLTPDKKNEKARVVTFTVLNAIKKKYSNGGFIHIETIQDIAENSLMAKEEFDVARSFVIYRNKHAEMRRKQEETFEPKIRILMPGGSTSQLDVDGLRLFLTNLAQDLHDIDVEMVLDKSYRSLYDRVPYTEVNDAMVLTARTQVEINPAYSFFAARILKHKLCEEVISQFEDRPVQIKQASFDYSPIFSQYISKGVEHELLSPAMLDFDLQRLEKAIHTQRDNKLTYLSLQTLYDRYLLHVKGQRIELPQFFFMRIAMGLCMKEGDNKESLAIAFYHLLSNLEYMCSTPTLFNSGTNRPQLSSCFLSTIEDSLTGIFESISNNAQLSKYAGGLGNDWTPVRANGSYIKGTNGKSSGAIPFLNIYDAAAIAVNQGGKRGGAVCAYMEAWHGDILDFLELRKNTGDDRRRTHDMNTAIWVPDLLMERVFEKQHWTLFSPDETPDLHDAYGEHFRKLYVAYEQKAEEGKIYSKRIDALTLWRKMLSMLFETGHPWITFKDPCNIRSPQQHVGVVHSSNLCTEITLNTSKDEVAVCNLGSINLIQHFDSQSKSIDKQKLAKTIQLAVRMLDNVIDVNHYPIEAAKRSNLRHRPVGLGVMGLQDVLHAMELPFESEEAVQLSDELMELISYHAIDASIDLAKERGAYPSYEGSLWSQDILPLDSLRKLSEVRGDFIEADFSSQLNWQPVREKLKHYGIRNSNLMAIAPTATISNICNATPSIEPSYSLLAVKSNMSGEFTIVNPQLIQELSKLKLWNATMLNRLKAADGIIADIAEIPDSLKLRFKTAFEIDPIWLVRAAARRQKWLDQSQSLNLFMGKPSGRALDLLYKNAWLHGLKTTYYLRSLAATSTEKATYDDGKLNAVKRPEQCSIEDAECEACQ